MITIIVFLVVAAIWLIVAIVGFVAGGVAATSRDKHQEGKAGQMIAASVVGVVIGLVMLAMAAVYVWFYRVLAQYRRFVKVSVSVRITILQEKMLAQSHAVTGGGDSALTHPSKA